MTTRLLDQAHAAPGKAGAPKKDARDWHPIASYLANTLLDSLEFEAQVCSLLAVTSPQAALAALTDLLAPLNSKGN